MKIRIRQIYYSFFQRFLLDKSFVPYRNFKANRFLENQIILKMYLDQDDQGCGYYGIVSWRFEKKTKKSYDSIQSSITKDFKSSDVYSFFLDQYHERNAYTNIWQYSVALWHPHLMIEIAQKIIDRLGYRADISELKTPIIFSNFWIAKPEIYRRYVREMLAPAMRLMEEDEEISRLCDEDSGYGCLFEKEDYCREVNRQFAISKVRCMELFGKPYYTYHPFICERLISTWLALNPEVTVSFI